MLIRMYEGIGERKEIMIKCNKGTTEINGNTIEIMVELEMLTRNVYRSMVEKGCPDEHAREMITSAYDRAFKTDEELEAEMTKGLDEKIKKCVDEIIKELGL